MTYLIRNPREKVAFKIDKMAKVSLYDGEHLMVGLNCFQPGQSHAAHAHAGADKTYYVISGEGRFTIGDEALNLEPGGFAFAPAGVMHGVENVGPAPLVVLVHISPPFHR